MTKKHRVRRTLLAMVAIAAVACATLGVLAGVGIWRPQGSLLGSWSTAGSSPLSGTVPSPSAGFASDVGIDRAPERIQNRRMIPDQFDAVTAPKKLLGTPWANVVVQPDGIKTMIGSRVTWIGYFRSLPHYDGSTAIEDVAALLKNSPTPDWLTETEPGVFLLKVGLVQGPGTSMTVAAPRVRELRMAANPYVYIAGVGATGTFRGVKVTSWIVANNSPDNNPAHRRPFVSYDQTSRLDVIDSEMCYLGTDASRAYGVSWGLNTGGQALRSVFHNNLFGAYTGRAVNVTFQDSVFRNNARYGLDPHTDSRGLTVIGNEAYGNNTHGIIFSKGVIDSVVANNHSHDNGANGIMMDELSNNNVIQNNIVERNHGGGIVLQGSSNVQVINNVVAGNTLGVRVNGNELGIAVANHVAGNQLSGNHNGINVYGGARDTTLQNNVVRDTVNSAIILSEPTTSQGDSVINARKAVVIGRGPSTLTNLSVQQALRGVVLNDGTAATLAAANISASEVGIDVHNAATITLSGASSAVTDARKGLVVAGTAVLNNIQMTKVGKGVVLGPSAKLTVDDGRIAARDVGLDVQGLGGSDRVVLHNSNVRATDPVSGASVTDLTSNDISATISWLAVAGAAFVMLALILHLLHRIAMPLSRVRHRGMPQPSGAPGV
jgi:parallel beta-helix repeat protein